MLIRIIPIGNISDKLLGGVCAELKDILDAECKVSTALQIPQDAFNVWKKQYDAVKIIDSLRSREKFIDKSIATLGVTDKDIFYNGLNFVFGVEEPTTSYGVISIARLRPEFYGKRPNPAVLQERTVKEAIHEIGHYFGLDHCTHPFCVMSFSPSVEDVDKKQKSLCNNCRLKLSIKGVKTEL